MRSPSISILMVLLGLLAGQVLAQRDLSGIVVGTILNPQLSPLAGADVHIVVRRGTSDVVLASTRTDADGHYKLITGAVSETPFLRVSRGGFASAEFELKPLDQGQGLLVPDINLELGRRINVELAEVERLDSADLELLVFPLHADRQVIDVNGLPLASTDFVGLLAEVSLRDGDYAFVVRDKRGHFAPELTIWKVGPASTALPPVQMSPSRTLVADLRSSVAGDYEAKIILGSGVWHPEGGLEYRLQITRSGKLATERVNTALWMGLNSSVAEVEIRSAECCASMKAMPGDLKRTLELKPGAEVEGSVYVAGTTERVPGARVQVGDQVVATDAEGHYKIHGILPGTLPVYVGRENFIGGHKGYISFNEFGGARRLNLELEPGAEISGIARDDDLKVLPQAMVGCAALQGQSLGLGRYMFAEADKAGAFSFRGIPAGACHLSILNPGSYMSIDDALDVEFNARVIGRPRLGRAALGRGKIENPDGTPAVGAYLYFVSAPAPLSMRFGAHLENRDDEVVVRKMIVDSNGEYQFEGMPPGVYDRVLIRPQSAPELLSRLSLDVGINEVGMDWRAVPLPTTTLDLPEDVVLTLKNESGLIDDIWLYRSPGEPRLALNLVPGRYRVEMQRAGISRFGKDDQPYREHLGPQILAKFGSESLDPIIVPHPDPVVFADLDLHLLVNGNPPADRCLELTVYSLAGSWPLKPLRLATSPGQKDMELKLPRGVYLIQGRQAEFAEGWLGPITLGTGFSEAGRPAVTLDLKTLNLVLGRVAPEVQDILGNRVMKVRIETNYSRLVRPFQPTGSETEVTVDGDFRLNAVATGTSRVLMQADELRLEHEVEIEAFQTLDLGELIPEAEDQPHFILDQRALFGAQLRDDRHQVGMKTLTRPQLRGAFEVSLDLEGERGDQALRVTRLSTSDSGSTTLTRDSILGSGRSALRLSLSLDGQSLRGWPLSLRPIQADGYDFERPGIDLLTDQEGRVAVDGLSDGSQALRFEYNDEWGHSYQVAVPLSLPQSVQPLRRHVDVVTSPLKIAARDERDGGALKGAQVRLKRTDLRGVEYQTVFRRDIATVTESRTDLDGEVRFESLPLGTYDIEVSYPGMVTQHRAGFSLLEKGPLRVLQLQLNLGRRAELLFREEDGSPLAGLRLFLFAESGFPIHDDRLLLTDADGRIELASLPEGPIEVRVQDDRHPAQRVGRFETAHGRRGGETFVVEKGARLEVVCREPGGRPVPGAEIAIEETLSLRYQGPEAEIWDEMPLRASSSGSRNLVRVPAGEFFIRASKEGYVAIEEKVILKPGENRQLLLVLERIP